MRSNYGFGCVAILVLVSVRNRPSQLTSKNGSVLSFSSQLTQQTLSGYTSVRPFILTLLLAHERAPQMSKPL
jgi:hypothetical protein